MTLDDATHYDLDDQDLRDPMPCIHRHGDPACTCPPEDEAPEPEIDPDFQFDLDLTAAFSWIRQYRAAVPPEVTADQVADKDLRDRLNETRRQVEEIIESLQSDWIPAKMIEDEVGA